MNLRNLWKKEEQKTETEVELEKLEAQRKIQEAKLRNAEIDDQVVTAVKINKLFSKLREGCKDKAEFERRLRHFAEQSNEDFEYLKQEFSFEKGVERLEKLDTAHMEKLEKLAGMDEKRRKMLGYGK